MSHRIPGTLPFHDVKVFPEEMMARTQLTAIDNNANVGEARYRQSFTRREKRWVIKSIMEKKYYVFLNEMQTMVLRRCKDNRVAAETRSVNLPQNIASEPATSKEEMIRRRRSRFDRSRNCARNNDENWGSNWYGWIPSAGSNS